MGRVVCLSMWVLAVGCSGNKDTDGGPTDAVDTDTDTDTDPGGDFDGDGYSVDEGDCDDNDIFVNPGAEDTWYDGIDSDCGGNSDFDQDGDGYDSDDYDGDDCDDLDPLANPGQTEVDGDGIDNDCDGCGGVDEVITRWHTDGDMDGYGDPDDFVDDCAQPPGTVDNGDDCDDTTALLAPGIAEVCDGIDQDCNGLPDDGLTELEWVPDADSDTYGDASATPELWCSGNQPSGWVTDQQDCDDADPDTYPGAPTVACDGRDNDCDLATVEPPGVNVNGVPAVDLPTALATAPAGALVEVCEGTYTVDSLVITVPLELRGLGGSELTTLDAGLAGPLLRVGTTAPVTVAGLTLTNGVGWSDFGSTVGGGLRLDDGADVTAEDLRITANSAGDGAGIHGGDDVVLTLTDSLVTFNNGNSVATPVPSAGGVLLGDRTLLTLEDTEITDNTAGSCGGLDVGRDGTITGIGTALIARNNTSLANAGGCVDSGGLISGIEVRDNTTSNATAGMWLIDTEVYDSVFADNQAGLTGGGVTAQGALLFDNVEFNNNEAFNGAGLDLVFDTTYALLVDCLVTNGDATFFAALGAGAYLTQGARMESVNTTWTNNLPEDVELGTSGNSYTYGGVADFVCDDLAGSCL